jgi:hypothetical protein
MNRREFFALFAATVAGWFVMPPRREPPETKRIPVDDMKRGGWPEKDDMKWYVYALPEQPHQHWPMHPVYNGPNPNYTITWHNTGINKWPTQC